MTIETTNTLLYIWLVISLSFPLATILIWRKNRRLMRNFTDTDLASRHYEEMLYAAKDGYLTYSVYKNKKFQFVSRRLATILSLKNGEQSTTTEVFSSFNRSDADKLTSAFNTLIQKGVAFELIVKTPYKKTFVVTGTRINSADSEINSNCIWFRDITKETNFIDRVTEDALSCRQKLDEYRLLIDNLPCPVWLRDDKMEISILNRPYLKLLGLKDFKELTPKNITLHDIGNTTNLLDIAKNARESNTTQKKHLSILNNGELCRYELTETPYYDSPSKTTRTIGSLIDITGFEEFKNNYQIHMDTHLEILSSLDTAFCIINTKHEFTFGNAAFLKLWNLPDNFLDSSPHYNQFLDTIREQKALPEVSDFKTYKEEENRAFDALSSQREDLLYIPDGRTFRRIRAPHTDGTIIAYEDFTDRLADARRLSDLIGVQQGILDNIDDSVIIFMPNLKIKTYNISFLTLWNISALDLDKQPYLREILDMQKSSLPEVENWASFRDDMAQHITACIPFTLQLKDGHTLKVTPVILADSSLMITYHKE